MLWDTDINPEGLAAKLSGKVNDKLGTYLNAGVFILDENAPHPTPGYMPYNRG